MKIHLISNNLFSHTFIGYNFDFPEIKILASCVELLQNAIGYLGVINLLIDFLILLCTQLIVIQDYSKQDANF